MTKKEKLEFKINILNDIKECMTFNFGSMNDTLNKTQLENLIAQYEEKVKEIK